MLISCSAISIHLRTHPLPCLLTAEKSSQKNCEFHKTHEYPQTESHHVTPFNFDWAKLTSFPTTVFTLSSQSELRVVETRFWKLTLSYYLLFVSDILIRVLSSSCSSFPPCLGFDWFVCGVPSYVHLGLNTKGGMALSSSSPSSSHNVPSCSLSWDGQTSLTNTKSCTKVKLVGLRVSSWRGGGSHVTRWCTRHPLNFASDGTAMIGTKLPGGHSWLHVNDFLFLFKFFGFLCKKNLSSMFFIQILCTKSDDTCNPSPDRPHPFAHHHHWFGFVVHSFVVCVIQLCCLWGSFWLLPLRLVALLVMLITGSGVGFLDVILTACICPVRCIVILSLENAIRCQKRKKKE